jgi:hypothetical protein
VDYKQFARVEFRRPRFELTDRNRHETVDGEVVLLLFARAYPQLIRPCTPPSTYPQTFSILTRSNRSWDSRMWSGSRDNDCTSDCRRRTSPDDSVAGCGSESIDVAPWQFSSTGCWIFETGRLSVNRRMNFSEEPAWSA